MLTAHAACSAWDVQLLRLDAELTSCNGRLGRLTSSAALSESLSCSAAVSLAAAAEDEARHSELPSAGSGGRSASRQQQKAFSLDYAAALTAPSSGCPAACERRQRLASYPHLLARGVSFNGQVVPAHQLAVRRLHAALAVIAGDEAQQPGADGLLTYDAVRKAMDAYRQRVRDEEQAVKTRESELQRRSDQLSAKPHAPHNVAAANVLCLTLNLCCCVVCCS